MLTLSLLTLKNHTQTVSNRLVDVSVSDSTNTTLKNSFELKLAKTTTRNQSEKQRIFNDLMRLYLANIVATDKCYFIISGKSTNFVRDFRDYPNTGTCFYKNWFAFAKGQSLTFDVATETNADYLSIYQTFITKYSGRYQGADSNVLNLPNQITTKCEFITGFKATLVPYMTGIWSIS